MRIGWIYTLAALFLFTLFSAPLYAGPKKIEGEVTGQIICFYHWKTDQEYQGSQAVCPNAEHDRSLVAEDGEIYLLVPAEGATQAVKELVRTPSFERKRVIVEGEVINSEPLKTIKVTGFKVM